MVVAVGCDVTDGFNPTDGVAVVDFVAVGCEATDGFAVTVGVGRSPDSERTHSPFRKSK